MNSPILHPLEEQRDADAGAFVAGILARADEAKRGAGWHSIVERAPDNVTLELNLEPLSVGVVTGWCSSRFLRGRPTFWARLNGPLSPAEIVFPKRWRVAWSE